MESISQKPEGAFPKAGAALEAPQTEKTDAGASSADEALREALLREAFWLLGELDREYGDTFDGDDQDVVATIRDWLQRYEALGE